MKSAQKLLITVLLLSNAFVHANFDIPLPFGTHERIIKVRDLPDTPQYQLKDGTYYDIGSMYEIKHIFGLSYSNSKSEYVGYIGSQDKYVHITPKELNMIIASTRTLIPEQAKITFFDKYVSKPLLLILLIGTGLLSRKFYVEYRLLKALNSEDDILPWPPTQVHE